jgi:hypothetical protein
VTVGTPIGARRLVTVDALALDDDVDGVLTFGAGSSSNSLFPNPNNEIVARANPSNAGEVSVFALTVFMLYTDRDGVAVR